MFDTKEEITERLNLLPDTAVERLYYVTLEELISKSADVSLSRKRALLESIYHFIYDVKVSRDAARAQASTEPKSV